MIYYEKGYKYKYDLFFNYFFKNEVFDFYGKIAILYY